MTIFDHADHFLPTTDFLSFFFTKKCFYHLFSLRGGGLAQSKKSLSEKNEGGISVFFTISKKKFKPPLRTILFFAICLFVHDVVVINVLQAFLSNKRMILLPISFLRRPSSTPSFQTVRTKCVLCLPPQ